MAKVMIGAGYFALIFSTISIVGSLRSSEEAFNCAQPTVTHYDSPDTIKTAYRYFLLQCHPDKRPTIPYQIAHNEFIDGHEAYEAKNMQNLHLLIQGNDNLPRLPVTLRAPFLSF